MRRHVLAALCAETVILVGVLFLGLDMFAHRRVERLGGVNVWGYRGPVMRQKQSNEIRLGVVGGDLAFGWGVAASETLAPSIRQLVALEVDRSGRPLTIVTAVNLGALGLAPDEYDSWITRFAYLRPDVLCVVVDPPNHALADSRFLPDRRSIAFATFGYAPILPLVAEEKASRIGSRALGSIGMALARMDKALSRDIASPRDGSYDRSLVLALGAALRAADAGVVLVLPPHGVDDDAGRAGLQRLVFSEIGDNKQRLQIVDLGASPELSGDELRLDQFNFSAGGHARVAERVAPAVLALLTSRGKVRS
jgi:hypothetical protein